MTTKEELLQGLPQFDDNSDEDSLDNSSDEGADYTLYDDDGSQGVDGQPSSATSSTTRTLLAGDIKHLLSSFSSNSGSTSSDEDQDELETQILDGSSEDEAGAMTETLPTSASEFAVWPLIDSAAWASALDPSSPFSNVSLAMLNSHITHLRWTYRCLLHHYNHSVNVQFALLQHHAVIQRAIFTQLSSENLRAAAAM